MIGLVWAQTADGVLGRANTIPWHVPEDLAHFKTLTAGATVVMGRRTWDSLPPRFRPLPGRRNVVLTRSPTWTAEGAEPAHDVGAALRSAPDVWVIGGAELYTAALPFADVLVVTDVDVTVDGDVHAPELGPEWIMTQDGGWQHSSSGLRYRIRRLRRD